jgi:spermidine/putrescine transport system substrate-binding protein
MPDNVIRVATAKNPKMSRRTFITTVAGTATAVAAIGSVYYYLTQLGAPPAERKVRYEGWGGTFQAGLRKASFDYFEKEYKITVVEGSFGAAEEILTKIKATGGGEWDVIEIDNESAYIAALEGLLEPINMKNVPNAEYLPDIFREPVGAPGLKEGIHYYLLGPIYGTTGLAYNYEKVPDIRSISVLWDETLAGRITVQDYWLVRIQHAAIHLGQDPNNIDDINAVWDALREQKRLVKKYWTSGTDFEILYETREAWLGEAWGGRILKMAKEGRAPMKYVVPEEGSNTWSEALAIAKNAPHKENAELLINFMLDPEVQQRIAEETFYPPCVEPKYLKSTEKIELLPDYVGSDYKKLKFADMSYYTKFKDEWSMMWERIKAE